MAIEQTGSPVPWARHTARSKLVLQLLQPRQPTVLVLSLPRSGSSWVGEALGCAIDAMYLREPVTQADHMFYHLGTIFAINTPDLETRYGELADKAFAGWPDFGRNIVRFPKQWVLRQRRSRRIVIKEVNPRACSWYLQRYAPRVVFLVRHPGAVAASWQRNGWLGADVESWIQNGRDQGRALREALAALERYPMHQIVIYEDLCADPMRLFQPLFKFAGLTWDAHAEQFIAERTRVDDFNNTWDTSRNSQNMIHSWRHQTIQANVVALRATFREFNLPWYRDDQDWIV